MTERSEAVPAGCITPVQPWDYALGDFTDQTQCDRPATEGNRYDQCVFHRKKFLFDHDGETRCLMCGSELNSHVEAFLTPSQMKLMCPWCYDARRGGPENKRRRKREVTAWSAVSYFFRFLNDYCYDGVRITWDQYQTMRSARDFLQSVRRHLSPHERAGRLLVMTWKYQQVCPLCMVSTANWKVTLDTASCLSCSFNGEQHNWRSGIFPFGIGEMITSLR